MRRFNMTLTRNLMTQKKRKRRSTQSIKRCAE